MAENGNNSKRARPKRKSKNRRPTQIEMKERFRIEATPEELVQALIKHRPKRS